MLVQLHSRVKSEYLFFAHFEYWTTRVLQDEVICPALTLPHPTLSGEHRKIHGRHTAHRHVEAVSKIRRGRGLLAFRLASRGHAQHHRSSDCVVQG
jgi:hypothetical protein